MKWGEVHLSSWPCSILKASITMHPAMTALVVAMAGMMLPAIDFTSNLVRVMGEGGDEG